MSRQRSLEQERAKTAWARIKEVKQHNEGLEEKKKYAKEYGSLAKSAPTNIQINGLGQTLAFLRAKGFSKGKPKGNGENAHCQLFLHVSEWVKGQLGLKIKDPEDLLSWIVNSATTDEYRCATAEAMAFLSWLKRFAEAELGEDE
ncbi:MAG: type III-B CRISPR module-associated protein Cmr5 [Bacillota bacterium]|nr:type III-B CRISPR module-associated protein Cmr5 [Bacillota bacterium]